MVMITSAQNERIKYVRSLARRRVRQRELRFVVEGTRLIDEVARGGIQPALVLYTLSWGESRSGSSLLSRLCPASEGCLLVSDSVLAACADTRSPQGVLAVVPMLTLTPAAGLVLILDGIRDPGNLGTILRSAEAAGVGQVLLTPDTVELYHPKVVRGAMGAHFRLSVEELAWPAIAERVAGRSAWLADADGHLAYDAVDWNTPSAIIIGGEAAGASQEAAALASGSVVIPMTGGTESLNAAMSATILLFEAARQRRRAAVTEVA
jgi:RNA methyltransferase, TrmH family